MRRYIAIFAVVALALLVLRPACDVLAAGLTGAPGASATLLHDGAAGHHLSQAATHWSSLAVVVNAAQSLFAAPAFVVATFLLAALALFTTSAAANAAPLPTRSYYSRSTRILR